MLATKGHKTYLQLKIRAVQRNCERRPPRAKFGTRNDFIPMMTLAEYGEIS